MIQCCICNKECKDYKGLASHIRQIHKITSEKYYNKYLNKTNQIGYCKQCNKKVKFYNIKLGYAEYCIHCLNTINKIKIKRKQIFINKYGVDNPAKHKDIQNKIKQTNNLKYNCDYPLQNKEILNKTKITLKEKYNVYFPKQIKNVKEKLKDKFLKYLFHGNRLNDKVIPLFTEDEFKGTKRIFKYKFKCIECGHEFYGTISEGRVPRCPEPHSKYVSELEISVRNYIKTIYTSYLIFSDRIIISPYELDIVIPDLNIAIEVNGDYYHSEKFGKDDNYHQMKMDLCKNAGYKLIYIWEHEWNNEHEKTKSFLKELIGDSNVI